MTERSATARIAVLRSWARTPDRTARTRNGRNAGPASVEWHIGRLDPDVFAHATDSQKYEAAEAAKKVYFAEMGKRSAASRRRDEPIPVVSIERYVASCVVDSDPTPPRGIERPLRSAS